MHKAIATILCLATLLGMFIFLGTIGFNREKQREALKKIENVINRPKINFPLAIDVMRKKDYPGSELKIESTLYPGSNYKRYIASYTSDGNKIYGLLTIPNSASVSAKVPAIIFNHGYIPPAQYVTTERYIAYQDGFARSGYVTFKSDYRGNGKSEGTSEGAYFSPDYTTDVLNALASVKKLPEVSPDKIGMWGHSMGGNISIRAAVVDPNDIKAIVLWAPVDGTYYDLVNNWHPNRHTYLGDQNITEHITSIRQNLMNQHGSPATDSAFWQSIDPYTYLKDINAQIQIHQGLADEDVPPLFQDHFVTALKQNGKQVEYFTYPGADHNLESPAFELAMQRSIEFFDKYLK